MKIEEVASTHCQNGQAVPQNAYMWLKAVSHKTLGFPDQDISETLNLSRLTLYLDVSILITVPLKMPVDSSLKQNRSGVPAFLCVLCLSL